MTPQELAAILNQRVPASIPRGLPNAGQPVTAQSLPAQMLPRSAFADAANIGTPMEFGVAYALNQANRLGGGYQPLSPVDPYAQVFQNAGYGPGASQALAFGAGLAEPDPFGVVGDVARAAPLMGAVGFDLLRALGRQGMDPDDLPTQLGRAVEAVVGDEGTPLRFMRVERPSGQGPIAATSNFDRPDPFDAMYMTSDPSYVRGFMDPRFSGPDYRYIEGRLNAPFENIVDIRDSATRYQPGAKFFTALRSMAENAPENARDFLIRQIDEVEAGVTTPGQAAQSFRNTLGYDVFNRSLRDSGFDVVLMYPDDNTMPSASGIEAVVLNRGALAPENVDPTGVAYEVTRNMEP